VPLTTVAATPAVMAMMVMVMPPLTSTSVSRAIALLRLEISLLLLLLLLLLMLLVLVLQHVRSNSSNYAAEHCPKYAAAQFMSYETATSTTG
jgi:hypothetical protein